MVHHATPRPPAQPRRAAERRDQGHLKAVLGPTNTGKTHLAIERLCAHSSGMIGFPLRLLAREVYDKVCAIKGRERVALITGEERIEPRDARWLLCTMEAMPVRVSRQAGSANQNAADVAFVALDEVQLCADRERGHVFTDRLLHARGREETMLLGSATMEPTIKALLPEVEVIGRPRFSTLSHAGAKKLSRIPPRSAIVAFSAEQVYAVAEMLRRFRGGAAVVMGALSPETRNRQVALFQSGEVDYLVATDAIGMGLNLDVGHVAFAGLSKFDGQRQRRLTPAEIGQIAGRAGRHQRDGTFGTVAGIDGQGAEFTDEEVYAVEHHRFAPVNRLFWRESDPDFDSLAGLIADLEAPPQHPELVAAPEAIDLAVLKRLADEPDIAATLRSPALLRRFWDVCRLPDFRSQGAETHARFVARLWQELRGGPLASDHVPSAIAQLDNVQGDIDTLQGRIAAIRIWAYVAQRPDWVLARDEMAERARAVEARLSDALHARLTERFVNRRTAVLMRGLGAKDSALLPVRLEGEQVVVEDEVIGMLAAFRFRIDPQARHADHRLLLAAAERHLPALLGARAEHLIADLTARPDAESAATGHRAPVILADRAILWRENPVARLEAGRTALSPAIRLDPSLDSLAPPLRARVAEALEQWLARQLRPLAPLLRIEAEARAEKAGPALRALLIRLVDGGGITPREGSGIEALDRRQRHRLRQLGVQAGALDLFVPAMLRGRATRLWSRLASLRAPAATQAPLRAVERMEPVLAAEGATVPAGYRRAGRQWLRIDLANRLLALAHQRRLTSAPRPFWLDPAPALAQGLTTTSYAQLLHQAGFRPLMPRILAENIFGPPAPTLWRWQPRRRPAPDRRDAPEPSGAFADLARLVA